MTLRETKGGHTLTRNDNHISLYKKFSPLDFKFYEHFKGVMEQEIERQGLDLQEEVVLFQEVLSETRAFCTNFCQSLRTAIYKGKRRSALEAILQQQKTFAASKWEPGFYITGYECVIMSLKPGTLAKAQLVKQHPDICKDKSESQKTTKYCDDSFVHTFPWSMLYNASSKHFWQCLL